MTLQEACRSGSERLKHAEISEADLDAWYLLAYITGYDRGYYYGHPEAELTKEQESQYLSLLAKRAARIPLQYLLGVQEFMGLSFLVNPSVLIPRPDTEILVEAAWKKLKAGMQVLDLCTGSGCILLSLLYHCPGLTGIGADISEEALEVARQNAERLGIETVFVNSDLFSEINGSFDMIVSNPPYIKSKEIPFLMEEVRLHEPVRALDGHEDGLYFYRRITEDCRSYLKEGGMLCFEIGCEQGDEVAEIMRRQGFCEIQVIKDLAGLDRVVQGKVLPVRDGG